MSNEDDGGAVIIAAGVTAVGGNVSNLQFNGTDSNISLSVASGSPLTWTGVQSITSGQVNIDTSNSTSGASGGSVGGQPGAVTLSKVAVHKLELSWLVSAKPIYALEAMGIVAVPCCVQFVPSGEY